MQLVDMKCEGGELGNAAPMPTAAAAPGYPYGLRIYLDDDSLEKLGIENLPELGSEFEIQAKVSVCARNERTDPSDPDGDNDSKSLELQITSLGLGLKKSSDKVASEMYAKGK